MLCYNFNRNMVLRGIVKVPIWTFFYDSIPFPLSTIILNYGYYTTYLLILNMFCYYTFSPLILHLYISSLFLHLQPKKLFRFSQHNSCHNSCILLFTLLYISGVARLQQLGGSKKFQGGSFDGIFLGSSGQSFFVEFRYYLGQHLELLHGNVPLYPLCLPIFDENCNI